MIDEFFDRGYQLGRSGLNVSLSTLVRSLGEALANPFKVLNRIEYSAPWAAKSKSAPCK